MLVKAIFRNKYYNYFVDKENGIHRVYGDIFMCSDELAEERIKKGLVKKTTLKEKKEYYNSIDTIDEDDLKSTNDKSKEGNTGDNGENDNNEGELPTNDDESAKIKSFLEECTKEELIDIAFKEDICIDEQMTEEQLIETINKVRAERLEQNGGEE